MTSFLAQLFGLYFLVVSIICLIRRKSVMLAVTQLQVNKAVMLIIGAVAVTAGIAVILAYPMPTMDLEGVLSVIGYVIALEGIFYLVIPVKLIRKVIKFFSHASWYISGTVVGIIGGAYLAGKGFGLF